MASLVDDVNLLCFGDANIRRKGHHTSVSEDRTKLIWNAIKRILLGIPNLKEEAQNRKAQDVARAMLSATKGPQIQSESGEPVDLRAHYRHEFADVVMGLQAFSENALNEKNELLDAMTMISKTNSGPKIQYPSAGCSVKWKN